MNIDLELLQHNLCKSLCAQIKLSRKNEKLMRIETPFFFSDGDPYQMYIKEGAGGVLRLTDGGHTMMHLSYENDIDKFKEGTRGSIFEQIQSEFEVEYENGEFFKLTNSSALVIDIFGFGQALTKVNDLTFLNRVRAESTFYDDLFERLVSLVPSESVHKNYINPAIDKAEDYPIDFYIETAKTPLYIFGIPNADKAKLTNIILERLLRSDINFESLLIFADQSKIPRGDIARLSNAGGEMISSLSAQEDLSRKVLKKVAL